MPELPCEENRSYLPESCPFDPGSPGLIHSLAHKIGGEFGVTHGLSNAILMPYDKYAMVGKVLGIKDLAEAVRELNKKLNIPATFKDCDEVDFSEAKFVKVLDQMSVNALADPCTLTNPGAPTVEDVKAIYEAAYYGKSMK